MLWFGLDWLGLYDYAATIIDIWHTGWGGGEEDLAAGWPADLGSATDADVGTGTDASAGAGVENADVNGADAAVVAVSVFDTITTEITVGMATIRWPVIVTADVPSGGLRVRSPNVVAVVLSMNCMLTYGVRSTTVAVHMYVCPAARLKLMPSVLVIAVPVTTGAILKIGLTCPGTVTGPPVAVYVCVVGAFPIIYLHG